MQQPQVASAAVSKPAAASGMAARDGVFATVDEAASAALVAQKKVPGDEPGRARANDLDCAQNLHRPLRRTGQDGAGREQSGRLDHKIQKLKNMQYVVGVEGMRSDARSDKSGC